MSALVELSNGVLYLLKIVSVMVPDEKRTERGYIRKQAILVGLFVRIAKLYECLIDNICKKRGETILIFTRLIFETRTKVLYLMESPPSSYRSFVTSSFRPEKEILKDIENKKKKRKLLPIEERMLQSVKKAMEEARISKKELFAIRNWKLDGKDFRAILATLGEEKIYTYAFRTPSHAIHGDWADLLRSHLKKEGRFYRPKLEFDTPDPRGLAPVSILVLDVAIKYLKKFRLDRDEIITSIAGKLSQKIGEIDREHEAFLGQSTTG